MSISIAGLAVGPGVGVRAAVAGRGVAAVAVAAKDMHRVISGLLDFRKQTLLPVLPLINQK